MTTRRVFLLGTSTLAANALTTPWDVHAAALRLDDEISRIEHDSGGRLGVAMFDTASHTSFDHRGAERFPMCSTFKLLACAAVLKRVEEGKERLDRRITFQASDVVVNSPITKDRTGGNGMSMAEICEAAMTWSDNTAGNLILGSLGGPPALNAYVRSIGDAVTRLDRIEPDLNEAVPGDLRDTTTPAAMLKNLQTLLLGNALAAASKEQLTAWLIANKTGDKRLRAGLPHDWRVGDKTGAGERGTTNDAGVLWPPQHGPIFVTIYLTQASADSDARNATLAAVGQAIASSLV